MKHSLSLVTRRSFLGGLIAFAALAHTGFANEPQKAKPIRILTVGNSFAEDAVRYLRGFGTAAGQEFIIGRANLSGCPLDRHANLAKKYEASPEDPAGYPYKSRFLPPRRGDTKMYSLKEMLEAEKWDYVTIQQASPKSFDWSTYEPHAGFLVDYIRKYAPQAEILIHQTWAYREDHPFFGEKGGPTNQREMYEGLRNAYAKLHDAYGFRMLPSGYTIEKARKTDRWTFKFPDEKFDYKNPPAKEVPEQPGSLHVGWVWRTGTNSGITRLVNDGIHLNSQGSYLIGALWFEELTGKNVEDVPYVPEKMDPEDAESLREIAHEAAEEFTEKEPRVSASL